MKPVFYASVLTLCLSLLSGQAASAQSIGLDPSETDPEKLGYDIAYTVGDLDPTRSYTFEWSTRENDDFVQPWQTADAMANFFSRKFNTLGTFDIRCIYTPSKTRDDPNPQPTTITRSVTISPPTAGDPTGLNVDLQYNPQANTPTATDLNGSFGGYLIFPLSDCGPYISIWAQEKITKVSINNVPQDDGDWVPPDNNDVRLQIKNDTKTNKKYIYDWKTTTVPTGGQPPVAPAKFASYTQSLRICWKNTNGDIKSASCRDDQDYSSNASNNFPPRWQTTSP